MQNKIAKIKDAHKRQQVTEICKRLQLLYNNKNFSNKQMDELIQSLELPLAIHLFITGYFSELMEYKYL